MVDELNSLERAYLRAMALCLSEDRVAQTAAIARSLNKRQRQLSRARESLIGAEIILAPARGEVMFNVPHLADYVQRPEAANEEVSLARSWRL